MKHKGQNLIEFLLILAVVAIASIFAFTLLGGNIDTLFNKISGLYTSSLNNNQNAATNDSSGQNNLSGLNQLVPGSLGGTTSNPVSQCDNGACTIDYGEFLLNGVPENFGELVQTTGASGGTESLLSLINQIADQLEQNGNTDGAKEYRQLANLGHFIAEVQEINENLVNSCSGQTGNAIYTCFGNARSQPSNMTLSPDVAELLPYYSPNTSLKSLTYETEIGLARNAKTTHISGFAPSIDPGASPAAAFVNIFDNIMANPEYSDAMKGVTSELYNNIGNLSKKHTGYSYISDKFSDYIIANNITNPNKSISQTIPDYDPITGASNGDIPFSSSGSVQTLLHPPTSLGTNLNSTLICAAGWNQDTGSNCH